MIAVSGVSKVFGGEALYENATFQINPGEKVGLVGKNGAGKTTFFRMIMGKRGRYRANFHSNGIELIIFSKRERDGGKMSSMKSLAATQT